MYMYTEGVNCKISENLSCRGEFMHATEWGRRSWHGKWKHENALRFGLNYACPSVVTGYEWGAILSVQEFYFFPFLACFWDLNAVATGLWFCEHQVLLCYYFYSTFGVLMRWTLHFDWWIVKRIFKLRTN